MNINALTPFIGPYPRGAVTPPERGSAAPDNPAPRPATPVERVIEGEWLSGRREDTGVAEALKRFLVQRGGDVQHSPRRARAAIDFYQGTGVSSAGRGDLDVYA